MDTVRAEENNVKKTKNALQDARTQLKPIEEKILQITKNTKKIETKLTELVGF